MMVLTDMDAIVPGMCESDVHTLFGEQQHLGCDSGLSTRMSGKRDLVRLPSE